MNLHVPKRSSMAIELSTAILLQGYQSARRPITEPPVPLDDIAENHLKLELSFDNLNPEGVAQGILGALQVLPKKILLDYSMDPVEHPNMRGRYRFTLAHECGHWVIHRHLILNQKRKANPSLGVICRSQDSGTRAEVQANKFAAYLLMPMQLVRDEWRRRFRDLTPMYLDPDEWPEVYKPAEHEAGPPLMSRFRRTDGLRPPGLREFQRGHARLMAGKFDVSIQAMRIRLENLGLLRQVNQVVRR